jgi:hypothetical protein
MRGILGSELTSYVQDLHYQSGLSIIGGPVTIMGSPTGSLSFYTRIAVSGEGGIINSGLPIITDVNALYKALMNNLPSASIGNGFYLQEQGAVFMIPTSVLRNDIRIPLRAPMSSIAAIDSLRERISKLEASVQEPGASHEDMVEARKQINELNKEMEPLRSAMQYDEAAINTPAFQQALDGLKNLLVDTLAKYGDSLSIVKPGEHINLILQRPSWDASGQSIGIISARKSWITDYKAGKMTLDEFRKRVLQYSSR